jgi:hypothetical protein
MLPMHASAEFFRMKRSSAINESSVDTDVPTFSVSNTDPAENSDSNVLLATPIIEFSLDEIGTNPHINMREIG